MGLNSYVSVYILLSQDFKENPYVNLELAASEDSLTDDMVSFLRLIMTAASEYSVTRM